MSNQSISLQYDQILSDGDTTEDNNAGTELKSKITEEANELVVEHPNLIPLTSEVIVTKGHLEQVIDKLTLDAIEIESRVAVLEPEQSKIKDIVSEIVSKTDKLLNSSEITSDKLFRHELELRDVSVLIDVFEDELEAQQKISSDLGKSVDSLGLRNKKIELINVKLSNISNKMGIRLTEHEQRLDVLDPGQKRLFTKTDELNQRTSYLEAKTVQIEDSARKTTLLLSSIIAVLLIAGIIVSVAGVKNFDKQLQVTLGQFQTKFQSVKSQLGAQGTVLAQESKKTAQSLKAIQQQIVDAGDVSQDIQKKYIATSNDIQSISEKLAFQEIQLDNGISGPESIQIKIHDSNWLLQQSPRHYAIQMVGVYNKRDVFDYIRTFQHLFSQPVAFLHTTFNGKEWFTLQYGQYNTMQQAKTALSELPKELLVNRPWVRSNKRLHALIK
jgi:hypothetical protein